MSSRFTIKYCLSPSQKNKIPEKFLVKLVVFWTDRGLHKKEYFYCLHCQGLYCRSGHFYHRKKLLWQSKLSKSEWRISSSIKKAIEPTFDCNLKRGSSWDVWGGVLLHHDARMTFSSPSIPNEPKGGRTKQLSQILPIQDQNENKSPVSTPCFKRRLIREIKMK